MFEIVKKAVDEFNLYGLLPNAPSNEFDSESRQIAGRITVNSSIEEISQVVCDVFSKAFGKDIMTKDFLVISEKVYKSINN